MTSNYHKMEAAHWLDHVISNPSPSRFPIDKQRCWNSSAEENKEACLDILKHKNRLRLPRHEHWLVALFQVRHQQPATCKEDGNGESPDNCKCALGKCHRVSRGLTPNRGHPKLFRRGRARPATIMSEFHKSINCQCGWLLPAAAGVIRVIYRKPIQSEAL